MPEDQTSLAKSQIESVLHRLNIATTNKDNNNILHNDKDKKGTY